MEELRHLDLMAWQRRCLIRILIADDSPTSRMILKAVLKKNGHEVVETADGVATWEALRQPEAPRLVILDWLMPGMNGLEVVQRVRAVQSPEPPYIIMLTARDDTEEIFAGLEAGANDYLAKPFNVAQLLACVNDGQRMVEAQRVLTESCARHLSRSRQPVAPV